MDLIFIGKISSRNWRVNCCRPLSKHTARACSVICFVLERAEGAQFFYESLMKRAKIVECGSPSHPEKWPGAIASPHCERTGYGPLAPLSYTYT